MYDRPATFSDFFVAFVKNLGYGAVMIVIAFTIGYAFFSGIEFFYNLFGGLGVIGVIIGIILIGIAATTAYDEVYPDER